MKTHRNETPNRERRHSGFTLIELLVVLIILAMLASVAGPRVIKYLSEAKTKAGRVQVQEFATAIDLYHLDVGKYPTREQGLESLVKQPSDVMAWNGPYLKKRNIPKDPWGNDYQYTYPFAQGGFSVFSLGADNAEGGEGENQDISNWE